jgi:hypothetical protein
MTRQALRIVVLGMMGRCPFGGQTWLYLNWLLGLSALGHDVWYVEDDTVWPYDPSANAVVDDCSYAVRHIASAAGRIGLEERWAFRLADRDGACWGLSSRDLDELYSSCDVLLNLGGATDLREPQLEAPFRVYVETDPVTCQLLLAKGDPHTRAALAAHHALATYGENYGSPDCGVPLDGLRYVKTRQPIALDWWPAVFDPDAGYFTTIGNYRQEGNDVELDGELYTWSKHHEWERIIELPSRTAQQFELALKIDDPRDQRHLERHGWRVIPSLEMSLEVFGRYPAYFQRARAEITVAKDQNVRLRSGWFSERDACYLASGKPVVAQETGFSNSLPTGEGLFGFEDLEQARAAVEAVNADYPRHCRAARALAEEHFEARAVAGRLLLDLGV